MNKQKIDLNNNLILRSENIEYNDDTLKNTLDKAISDSGWIDLEITSNFQLYKTNGHARYRKIGNIVNLDFALSPASDENVLNSATETLAFTLPDICQLKYNSYFICNGSSTYIYLLSIKKQGVFISRYRNTDNYSDTPPKATAWLPGNITYFVA